MTIVTIIAGGLAIWFQGAVFGFLAGRRNADDLRRRVAELEAAVWEDDPDPDPGEEAPVVVPFRGKVA